MHNLVRKITFFILIFLSYNIYALDHFDIKWNLGNAGFGTNWFENDVPLTENYLEIFNIAVEHYTSGIGLELNPAKYWNYIQKFNYINVETESWSFLNLGLYWNVVNTGLLNNTINFNIELFNNINYLFYIKDKLDMNSFIYTAGIRAGLSLPLFADMNYFLLGVETGYRNTSGKNTFYFSFKIDFLLYLMSTLSSSYYK